MPQRLTRSLLLANVWVFAHGAAGIESAAEHLSNELVGAEKGAKPLLLTSSSGRLQVTFELDEESRPNFQVGYDGVLLLAGRLGLEFAESGQLGEDLQIVGVRRKSRDQSYEIAVGKASLARDRHDELIVSLEERDGPGRRLEVAFRAFDDGIAFRYLLPEQEPLAEIRLLEEHTKLNFLGDPTARVLPLPRFTTPYEKYYQTLKVSEIGSEPLIGLPMLLERPVDETKSLWVVVTEASLCDYAGMYFVGQEGEPGWLASKLSPLPGRRDAVRVVGETPFASPWRVIMIADDLGRLIESNIIFNLNEPSALADPSWIRPGKTTFGWWNHYILGEVDFEPGVNTATMKHYIDFCAEQGIPYHTVDGLDIAWYGGPIAPRGSTDVTTAAASIDMPELLRYAGQKGVRLRLWVHWKALQPQLDEAFATYERWGIEGVMIDFMNRDDQEMVRWYHQVARKAAEHHLTVTWHGAYKPTGMERTWPNVLSYEAVLNQEFNKWGARGAFPKHNLDVAFIRMLAGPLDYHQGGMRSVLPEDYRFSDAAPPVQGTRGHQLAMYVVFQNHLAMMADFPTAYRGQPGLEFMVNVPATWDETHVLHAEIGKCIVIARRKGDDWYLGGMTAEEPRLLSLPLAFLGEGSFSVSIYTDDPDRGPNALKSFSQFLSATDSLDVTVPRSGGFAARFTGAPQGSIPQSEVRQEGVREDAQKDAR